MLEGLTALTFLDVSECRGLTGKGLAPLGNLTRLQHLRLQQHKFVQVSHLQAGTGNRLQTDSGDLVCTAYLHESMSEHIINRHTVCKLTFSGLHDDCASMLNRCWLLAVCLQ